MGSSDRLRGKTTVGFSGHLSANKVKPPAGKMKQVVSPKYTTFLPTRRQGNRITPHKLRFKIWPVETALYSLALVNPIVTYTEVTETSFANDLFRPLGVLLLGFLALFALRSSLKMSNAWILLWILVVFIAGVWQTLFGVGDLPSLNSTLSFMFGFMAALTASGHFETFLRAQVLTVLIFVPLTILAMYQTESRVWMNGFGDYQSLSQTNIALVGAIGMLSFMVLRELKKIGTTVSILIVASSLFLILARGQAGATVAFAIAIILGAFLSWRKRSKPKINLSISPPRVFLIIGLSVGAALVMFSDTGRAGVASLLGRSETWSGRDVVWEAALEKFDKSIIFGHGFGQDIVTLASGSSFSSHNGYLGMLITWGFFAILVVLPLIIIALYRSLSLSPWLFASIIFFLIVNLSLSEWSPASVTGFFFFSCIFFVLGSTAKGVAQLSTVGSRSALSER